MFENLLKPITINKTEIRNRTAYPSLALLYSYDMKLNDRHLEFYRERAKGGAGIVTVGPVGFDDVGAGLIGPSIATDEAIEDFKKVADAINAEGAASWVQLYHAGAYSKSMIIGGKQAIAPSGVQSNYTKEMPRELTIEEIKELYQTYAKAALRVKKAGFTGVEILASAGYLITQFLSPLTNKRTDEYGGSFENRTRFAKELIETMREAVGADYPISIRMAGNDFVTGSNTDAETPAFAKVYEDAGVDLINVTGGWHETKVPQLSMDLPRGAFAYLAESIKKAVTIPVMASNRISTPELAEEFISDGVADMVNLGRVLIADPFWPKKAEANRAEEIRPCIACNQGCTDQIFFGKPLFCIVNAEAGFEESRKIKKVETGKHIMIIGAGPAGLEAAIRANEAGHTVEVFEKSDDIGGQLWIAGTPPHKQELWELIRYYETELIKNEIPVHLETEVTLDLIKEVEPDFIFAAEGAEPLAPPIEGLTTDSSVYNAWDILKNNPKLGKKVAVIGGGAVGLETAHYISEKGTITPETLHFLFKYKAESDERLHELVSKGNKDVTVFEMMPKIGKGVGKSTKWILLGNLDDMGVQSITEAKVVSIKDGVVTFERDGKTESIKFDNVVNAAGSKSVKKIADQLESTGIPFKILGDSEKVGQINDAIHSAYLAVMEL